MNIWLDKRSRKLNIQKWLQDKVTKNKSVCIVPTGVTLANKYQNLIINSSLASWLPKLQN